MMHDGWVLVAGRCGRGLVGWRHVKVMSELGLFELFSM